MKNLVYYLLAIYAVCLGVSIACFNGTGDSGDSVTHYLFAKYAPSHPELYFHHWAKPVFVLLASPFAQFGFVGVKVFNAIVTLITIFFTWKIAQELNLKNAWLVVVVSICSPLYYILTLSGLTEPLFALFTALGIYFLLKQKYISACVLASFLPYVRSEGLIILGVFGFYLLIKGKWKLLPLMLTGSILYSIAGYFVHHNLLWVFTKIPYATLNSVYGKGTLTHFVEQLINVIGIPCYGVFWLGVVYFILQVIKRKASAEQIVLILFSFLAFFVAHSLFWYLGIFNSFGLKRVLIGIMPMTAILCVYGLNFLTDLLPDGKISARKIVFGLLVAYIIVFPFTDNPAAIHWKTDMCLEPRQQAALTVGNIVQNNKKNESQLLFNDHYFSMILNIDDFDESKRKTLTETSFRLMKEGDIIIWDNTFMENESSIRKVQLDSMSNLKTVFSIEAEKTAYTVYQKIK